MKVLWICNVVLPMIAGKMNIGGSNKEGWVSALAEMVLERQKENGIELAIAFPISNGIFPDKEDACKTTITVKGASLDCYGFREDVRNGEDISPELDARLEKVLKEAKPDLVHCFGTEFSHAYMICRMLRVPQRKRLLVSLQGLCGRCADAYYANLPQEVIEEWTLRDRLRKDNIEQQRNRFLLRGVTEMELIKNSFHITGRTEWDRKYVESWNKDIAYHKLDENLRSVFYGPVWDKEKCIPHSVFVSQGDYPLKGLHYMLLALPAILKEYPDTTVYVAGNSIVKYDTLKNKLKISAYGKYLRKLMRELQIEDKIIFLGMLDAEAMLDRYLQSSLFVCCSTEENSPNSLGEAMMLGMPCVTADVGGISSVFDGGRDGIMYEGYRFVEKITPEENEKMLKEVSERLAAAVLEMWSDPAKMEEYCANARNHALITHDREKNYRRLLEIYAEVMSHVEQKKD